MQDTEIVIVAAGPGPPIAVAPAATVIAADGGLQRAYALGLGVDAVIGDLDSTTEEALARAEREGARIVAYPTAKDATDLELAFDEALALAARRVLLIASAEGRLDHVLASLLLLGSERYAGLELDARVGEAHVHVVRTHRLLNGEPGELVSLFALGGPAEGVTTRGLEYALEGETLEPGSSRGVSNVFVSPEASVTVARGTVLAVRPGSPT